MAKYTKTEIPGKPNYLRLRRKIEHYLRNNATDKDLLEMAALLEIQIPIVPKDCKEAQLELPLEE